MIRHNHSSVAFLLGVVALLFVTIRTSAGSQDPGLEPPWPFEVTQQAFKNHEQAAYLTVVSDLLDRESEARADSGLKQLYFDYLGTYLAMVSEHDRALRASDEAFGRVFERSSVMPTGADPLQGYEPANAVGIIVARAKARQVVMVNEEHRSTVQRAFTNRLLEPLRNLGFGYLAVEAVAESAEMLTTRGYPVLSTGTYTRDPVFGDLLRRAIELGYKIVPYEASPAAAEPRPDDETPLAAMNRRERAQATNIFARTLEKDPKAKVLVIAGRDHIAEGKAGGWLPMGAILKELSGTDPLTINQTVMTEHGNRRFEHWAFARADGAGWLNGEPVLLVDKSGSLWSAIPDSLDASLFHPRTRYENGRPHWMRMGGLRRPVLVDLPKFERPMLLQAHVIGEGPEAVPVDQIILWPGQAQQPLMLRNGRYFLSVLERHGKELHRKELVVERLEDAAPTQHAASGARRHR